MSLNQTVIVCISVGLTLLAAGCSSRSKLEENFQVHHFQCTAKDNNWYSAKMANGRMTLLLNPPSEVQEDFQLDKLAGSEASPELYIKSKKGEVVVAFHKKPCGPKDSQSPYSCTLLSSKRQFFGCGSIDLQAK